MDENILIMQRIERLEKDVAILFQSTNGYSDRLARMEAKFDYVVSSLDDLKISITKLNDNSGKRWETLVTSGITGVVTGTIAFTIAKLTGGK